MVEKRERERERMGATESERRRGRTKSPVGDLSRSRNAESVAEVMEANREARGIAPQDHNHLP